MVRISVPPSIPEHRTCPVHRHVNNDQMLRTSLNLWHRTPSSAAAGFRPSAAAPCWTVRILQSHVRAFRSVSSLSRATRCQSSASCARSSSSRVALVRNEGVPSRSRYSTVTRAACRWRNSGMTNCVGSMKPSVGRVQTRHVLNDKLTMLIGEACINDAETLRGQRTCQDGQ
jgi:hypothetical protein